MFAKNMREKNQAFEGTLTTLIVAESTIFVTSNHSILVSP